MDDLNLFIAPLITPDDVVDLNLFIDPDDPLPITRKREWQVLVFQVLLRWLNFSLRDDRCMLQTY